MSLSTPGVLKCRCSSLPICTRPGIPLLFPSLTSFGFSPNISFKESCSVSWVVRRANYLCAPFSLGCLPSLFSHVALMRLCCTGLPRWVNEQFVVLPAVLTSRPSVTWEPNYWSVNSTQARTRWWLSAYFNGLLLSYCAALCVLSSDASLFPPHRLIQNSISLRVPRTLVCLSRTFTTPFTCGLLNLKCRLSLSLSGF